MYISENINHGIGDILQVKLVTLVHFSHSCMCLIMYVCVCECMYVPTLHNVCVYVCVFPNTCMRKVKQDSLTQ